MSLWPEVAKRLSAELGERLVSEQVQGFLTVIVGHRNRIAHEADRDPHSVHDKQPISGREASDTIDRIGQLATAIIHVLGAPPPIDGPEDADGEGGESVPAGELFSAAGRNGDTHDDVVGLGSAGDPLPVTSSGRSPTGSAKRELYQRFWSMFRPITRQRGWTQSAAPAENWWSLPAGVTGVAWVLSFARFGCRSEIYFEHPDPAVNLARWQVLADRRTEIDTQFGDGLIFDDLPNNKGCRIETRLIGPRIEDEHDWPDVLRWMEEPQTRLRSAVDAAGGVPNTVPPKP
ncbi:MAG: DUF4268 domain-containing protein [Labedaea sp.]